MHSDVPKRRVSYLVKIHLKNISNLKSIQCSTNHCIFHMFQAEDELCCSLYTILIVGKENYIQGVQETQIVKTKIIL